MSAAERDAVILQLCAMAPRTVRELAELMGRSALHIRPELRHLVRDGRLVQLHPDQPSHSGQRYRTSSLGTTDASTPDGDAGAG